MGNKLYLLMVSSLLLCSCGGNKEQKAAQLPEPKYAVDKTAPGWKKSGKDPVTLTWYMDYSWYNQTWGKDYASKKMQEDSGVTVQFIAGDDSKLNSMIAAGRLPDIITVDGNSTTFFKEPIVSSIALEMDTLANKYDPYFFTIADKDVIKWRTEPNGHFYGYTNYTNTYSDFEKKEVYSNNVLLVRKDIYEALGKPDMSTPDGFINTLTAVAKKYPKTTDGLDILPLGMLLVYSADMKTPIPALTTLLQDFLGIPYVKDGQLYDRTTDPEYIKWLKIYEKAYQLGLLKNDLFTDNNTMYQEKVSQGRYFAIFTENVKNIGAALRTLNLTKPSEMYIPINGPANSNGAAPMLRQTGIEGWTMTMISKKCKDPERAMHLITYMMDREGQVAANFGKEGITFSKNGDTYKLLPEAEQAKSNPMIYNDKYGMGSYWQFANNRFQFKYLENDPALQVPFNWTRGKVVPNFEMINTDPDGRTKLGREYQKINTKFNETLIKMIRADSDSQFEKLLDEFLQYRKENEWKEIQEYRTQQMLKNVEKLDKIKKENQQK